MNGTKNDTDPTTELREDEDEPALPELESEIESPGTRTLRGRLHAPDSLIHRVEVVVGDERLATHPDAGGAFVFDRLPTGRAYLTVTGPQLRYRLPPVE